ncbi:MAG TPA: PDZ domain-containing protein [Isosphaeraceae bacterium]|jgi:membrane-associated protease RseP (regulator of RpoE activity)|nr:PDZ domain-containing protein [Isosphaeraceae bacterium]
MSDSRSLSRLVAGVWLIVLLSGTPGWAERPPERKEEAALVVTGQVEKVYTNVDEANINQIVAIRIDSVERGKGFNPGDLLDARCFRRKPNAPRIPAAYGHHDLPREGERIRAYLNPRDGGVYEGIYPDWIDRLAPAPPGGGPPGPQPWTLGVFTQSIGLGNRTVLQITRVVPGSAAQRANLEPGDMILDANGTPTRTPQELKQAIDRSNGSLRLTVRDVRTGRNTLTDVTLDSP